MKPAVRLNFSNSRRRSQRTSQSVSALRYPPCSHEGVRGIRPAGEGRLKVTLFGLSLFVNPVIIDAREDLGRGLLERHEQGNTCFATLQKYSHPEGGMEILPRMFPKGISTGVCLPLPRQQHEQGGRKERINSEPRPSEYGTRSDKGMLKLRSVTFSNGCWMPT